MTFKKSGIYSCRLVFSKEVVPCLFIGLITVFDAILRGRQSGQKLQCLYGNPIANNFSQN